MSTLAVNAISPASGGTVTITGAALTTPALGTPASGNLANCTGLPASAVVNTPSGGISATNVQAALNELDTEKLSKGEEGTAINGATAKATPIDADMLGVMDSAASNVLKKLSWANVKATLKSYFDSLYPSFEYGNWTPQLKGASPNGTYEIAVNYSTFVRVGRLVCLSGYFTLAGSVTGGGGAHAIVTGLPFNKRANTFPAGAVNASGIDLSTGTVGLTVQFTATGLGTALYFAQLQDNAANIDLPISAFGPDDNIYFQLTYEADGY